MSEEQQQQQEKKYPAPTSAKFASGALITALPVLAHFGPTGLLLSGIAGFVAYRHGPEVYDLIRHDLSFLPSLEGRREPRVRMPGERTMWERLIGAPALHDEQEEQEQEEPGQPTDAPREEEQQVGPQRLFPMYGEAETLRLGRVAATGQRFDPHFNQALGQGLIIAAVQGSGKSIINGVIIERAGRAGLPAVVLDHKGEYDTVTELTFVNGLRAGAGDESDFHLTAENADEFVRQIMENRHQAIINLPSYGDSWVARATIVAAVGKALMSYAALMRRTRQLILPCLVIVDEAQLYFPQNVQLLPAEARKNEDVLSDLSNAYFALVSNGRSNGYTMCFATQSLTFIAKWAIKSCQIKIFMHHVEKNDLDECERAFSPYVTRKEFETFPAGTGVVSGFTPSPMVVKFDMKKSRDLSQTPMLDRLSLPRQAVPVTDSLPEHEVDALLDEVRRRPDIDTDDSRYERVNPYPNEPAEAAPATIAPKIPPVARKRPVLSAELQATLEARRQHPEASLRQLGVILEVNKDTVGKRLEILRGFGYRV